MKLFPSLALLANYSVVAEHVISLFCLLILLHCVKCAEMKGFCVVFNSRSYLILTSCSVAILTNIICANLCRNWVLNTRRQNLFDLPTASLYCRRYLPCRDHFEENQFCVLPRETGCCRVLYQFCFQCPTHHWKWPQVGDDHKRDLLHHEHWT